MGKRRRLQQRREREKVSASGVRKKEAQSKWDGEGRHRGGDGDEMKKRRDEKHRQIKKREKMNTYIDIHRQGKQEKTLPEDTERGGRRRRRLLTANCMTKNPRRNAHLTSLRRR